jgi:type III secretion protein C
MIGKKLLAAFFILTSLQEISASLPKEEIEVVSVDACTVNFPNVSIYELVKFISKLAEVNFMGEKSLLDFEVSFVSGCPSKPKEILSALIKLLDQNGLSVDREGDCFIINKKSYSDHADTSFENEKNNNENDSFKPSFIPKKMRQNGKFFVYKLQYHQGSEIVDALKQLSPDTLSTFSGNDELSSAVNSMHWVQSTNSLFFTGSEKAIEKVCDLIKNLDTPLKQVFIEVLVIETNINNSLDFGLQWSANSKYKNRLGVGIGSFHPTETTPLFGNTMQSIGTDATPTGLNQFPIMKGFELGIIGDTIFHKGQSFLSLGSLLSALQRDGEYTIVLNQKIMTQENKNSMIFVGDTIPFAGSIVETVGSGQQTTSNIEYKDIGVSLNITPLLGDSDIITLDIREEITEALEYAVHKSAQLSGIKTSKINMNACAHVPDDHFLILSGMTRNVKAKEKSGIPCLGGIPFIGNLFNKKDNKMEKTNILIFVKPHIISSPEAYIDFSDSFSDTSLEDSRSQEKK